MRKKHADCSVMGIIEILFAVSSGRNFAAVLSKFPPLLFYSILILASACHHVYLE